MTPLKDSNISWNFWKLAFMNSVNEKVPYKELGGPYYPLCAVIAEATWPGGVETS